MFFCHKSAGSSLILIETIKIKNMKQKLLSGLIALFLCLSNVSAGDNLNNIFKKYQKYKGEEIICEQLDLPKELRKAKAGKTSKDIARPKYLYVSLWRMYLLRNL